MTRFIVSFSLVLALLINPAHATEVRDGAEVKKNTQADAGQKPRLTFREILNRIRPGREEGPVEVTYSREWIDARPTASGDEQWACLSEALYFEARGETVKGQFAVGEVILNRVLSTRFPDTPCGVIKQGTGKLFQCQFTYTCDGRAERIAEQGAYDRVGKVARLMLDGAAGDLTGGATYYHNQSVRPSWSRKFTKTASIGVHVFYKPDYRTASSQ
jgi:spore germination cell wall hydrolase CwlJ-like protein